MRGFLGQLYGLPFCFYSLFTEKHRGQSDAELTFDGKLRR
jgi:hypothetical protein